MIPSASLSALKDFVQEALKALEGGNEADDVKT
jgi:hypothetical protein